ncbi:MAG: class I SAM-dependent methyltransferase [Deltaproteobacteria bacterium]|nr:class I SAM-dependent methyltransferase [Deltaproteobacteria bacterium]
MYSNIKKCRISSSDNLISILELGKQPLANELKREPEEAQKTYPLTLTYCPESSLIQLKETVNKEILFSNYTWVTGTSSTTIDYANLFFQKAVEIAAPDKSDLIIEIASNDGTLLMPFLQNGYKNVLGVDAASNIVEIANQRGVRTKNSFWNKDVSDEIRSKLGEAKIVFARNVIPHVSELHDVVSGIENMLGDDGIGIIEFHYAGQILQELHYDSIYHEHLCYFSIKSMEFLLGLFGLIPFHIDISPISGGSYVIYFSKRERQKSKDYTKLIEKEKRIGVNDVKAWFNFAEKSYDHREKSRKIAESFLSKTVVGFGASARSSTYLNFCGFDSSHINAIIDNNKLKNGKYSPGSSIPIVNFEKGMGMNPDLIFILAWNFRDEIVRECRESGYEGDFFVAFPENLYFIEGKS